MSTTIRYLVKGHGKKWLDDFIDYSELRAEAERVESAYQAGFERMKKSKLLGSAEHDAIHKAYRQAKDALSVKLLEALLADAKDPIAKSDGDGDLSAPVQFEIVDEESSVANGLVVVPVTAPGNPVETNMVGADYVAPSEQILSADDSPLDGSGMSNFKEISAQILSFDANEFAKSVQTGEILTGADIGQSAVMGAGAPSSDGFVASTDLGPPTAPSVPEVTLSEDDRPSTTPLENHQAVLANEGEGGSSDLDSEVVKVLGKDPVVKSASLTVASPEMRAHDMRSVAAREAAVRKHMPASPNGKGPMMIVGVSGIDEQIAKSVSEGKHGLDDPILGLPATPLLTSWNCGNELCKSSVPSFLSVCPNCGTDHGHTAHEVTNLTKSLRQRAVAKEFYLPLGFTGENE